MHYEAAQRHDPLIMTCCTAKRLAVASITALVLLTTASAQLAAAGPATEPSSEQGSTTSGDVLLLLKDSIPNWDDVTTNFQGWTGDATTACTWTGVLCNANNDVTAL